LFVRLSKSYIYLKDTRDPIRLLFMEMWGAARYLQVTALSGGVGGAKLVLGLSKVLRPGELTVVGNTGDDFELLGLHISPDLDIVMYTLAGIVDEQKGWGVRGDTFSTLDSLSKHYGLENWFRLGDRDMATHIYRTSLLAENHSLSETTAVLCSALGVSNVKIIPMSDDKVQTRVKIENGSTIHFQDYFVRRGCTDKVTGIIYDGSNTAQPARGVLESIAKSDIIVICPSNPIASIGPILSVRRITEALEKARCPVVAISPIIQGKPLKGPADKFMEGMKLDVSAFGVAKYYRQIIDYLVINEVDTDLSEEIESLGVRVHIANTIMNSLEDKIRVASTILRIGSDS
jgi:LPPG:FO 2-phospho-L-lactate transferase